MCQLLIIPLNYTR